MPSVTQGIQSGYKIGRAFADPAPTEPSKMQSYVMKELIEGAYGVFRRKDGSVYVPQHFPKEARQLVIHKYIEKEKQASKEMFEEKKSKIEMVGKLQGVMEKVSEWGTDPKTKNFAIATYTQMIGEILGDKAQEMGVDKIADVATAAVNSQERKEAVDQKLYEILSGLFLRYNETGDIDYLNKYASLFAADPKKFTNWGLSNPQTKIEDHFEKLEKDNLNDKPKVESKVRKTFEGDPVFPPGLVVEEKFKDGVKTDTQILSKPSPLTQEEESERKRVAAVPKLEKQIADKGPMAVYRDGWKMNDDGTLWVDAATGAPQRLESFDKKMGKRGAVKSAKLIGEAWDDAKEIRALLVDPEVAADFKRIHGTGAVSQIKDLAFNKLQKLAQTYGFSLSNPKTREAIIRIQSLASEDRSRLLGAAVTNTEMLSVKGWMLDAGDTLPLMLSKLDFAEHEGRQDFTRWLDMYKDQANMAPFYNAFGIDRFVTDMDLEADQLIQEVLGK
jgi:hypothetical protein